MAARKVVLGYIGVVIAVFVVVAALLITHDGPDASSAPVLAVGATLPTSLVIILIPGLPEPWDGISAATTLVTSALLQAYFLWLLFRGRRIP